MDKKNFWSGFATGSIAFLLVAFLVYNKFVVQPDVSLNQLEVQDLNGQKVELKKYLGKPLVVNYWATWCGPCVKEFPFLSEVKQQMGTEVNFLMISDEAQNKIVKFSQSKPYDFNYLVSNKSFNEYGINSRPATYFYNAKGVLVTKHTGSLDSKTLKELISKIK